MAIVFIVDIFSCPTLKCSIFSTNSVVNSLKEIANSSEGNTVLISYKGNSAKADIALPSNFSVKLDDSSVKALDKRFGAENVEFVYHTQTHIN